MPDEKPTSDGVEVKLIWPLDEDIFKPVLSEHARGIQEELRARWPSILARAQALRNDIPDPVQAMAEFLNSLPGDDDLWREIAEEPYG
ncbi:MAG TPA: hypothetical protein VJL59_20005 [Anaerolineales bacterium]|nr:hypothetical protein [Anaerolineales bacterium]